MEFAVILFMLIMAVAIAVMWTLDIRAGRGYVSSAGLIEARDPDNGNRMVLHWLAEYATAAALLVGAVALIAAWPEGEVIAVAALGALAYTSVNSLAWVFAERQRLPYSIPMLIGLAGAFISITVVISA